MLARMSDWADMEILYRVRASVFRLRAESAGTAEERAACQRIAEQWRQKAEDAARDAAAPVSI
jgi:hypothetical protein